MLVTGSKAPQNPKFLGLQVGLRGMKLNGFILHAEGCSLLHDCTTRQRTGACSRLHKRMSIKQIPCIVVQLSNSTLDLMPNGTMVP